MRKKMIIVCFLVIVIITGILLIKMYNEMENIKRKLEKIEIEQEQEQEKEKEKEYILEAKKKFEEYIIKYPDYNYEYISGEYYTEFNYYYLKCTSKEEKNLKDVSYTRYVYENNEWVRIENQTSFLNKNRNEIYINGSKYEISLYDLSNGKNKIKVVENFEDDTQVEREYIINKVSERYDEMYQMNNIDESDDLMLNIFQNDMAINFEDYRDILLTGNYYSKNNMGYIEYIRYKLDKDGNVNLEKDFTKEYAYIYDNYWTIDIKDVYDCGEKIVITIFDSFGNNVSKELYIKDNSKDYDFSLGSMSIKEMNNQPYATNLINITFGPNVLFGRRLKIIEEIGGIDFNNLLVMCSVILETPIDSYDELNRFCRNIEEQYPEVLLASPVSKTLEPTLMVR